MEADEAGHWERSVPLYTKGLEVINEALQLRVPSIGLLPRADKVVSMKSEMKKWEQHISRRCGAIGIVVKGFRTSSQVMLHRLNLNAL